MVRTLFLPILLFVILSCSESHTEQCNSDSDCPNGKICNLETNKCQECTPECTGKCCGDDGCGGTCPLDCQTGYFCDQITCECDYCGCTTDADCFPDRCCQDCVCIEKDCYNLECGLDLVCGLSCGDCLGCSGEPDPALCNADGTCQQVCCPDCEGKCCGDDGCGGTCSDECSLQGMVCVPSTCNCSEPGQIGDPCPYEDAHLDKPECNAAEELFCVGRRHGDFICPNGTDEECFGYYTEDYNPVCVDGYCKASICTKECKRLCDCCPRGFYPDKYQDDRYICLPGNDETFGYICAYGDVNNCYGPCGETCMGAYPSAFIGLCPSGYFTECRKYVPPRFNPDCIDGLCGLSFCAYDCVNDGCDPYSGYEPTDQGGNCMCFPIPDPSAEGMPCELGDVNAFWGVCEPGLTCVGLLADGSNGDCPNGIPDCSSIPSSWNPFCDKNTNHCGASFCAKECDAGACEAGFIPFNYGATCYCAPEG